MFREGGRGQKVWGGFIVTLEKLRDTGNGEKIGLVIFQKPLEVRSLYRLEKLWVQPNEMGTGF